jgi:hypothetical protein
MCKCKFSHRCNQEFKKILVEIIPQEDIGECPNEEFEFENIQDVDIVQVIATITRRVSGLQREIRNMTTFYNPNPGETTEIAMLARHNQPTYRQFIMVTRIRKTT